MMASVTAVKKGGKTAPFVKDVLVPAWRKNLNLVRQKGTEIVARFPKWGVAGLSGFSFSFLGALGAQSVLHAAMRAEEEGFDAVIITSFIDPLLYQIRQAVNIPIVSLGESSMLLASIMGRKFGIVTASPYVVCEQEHVIEKYGLRCRFAGCRPNPEPPDEQPLALVDARRAIEAFKKTGRALIADGAEILIPG